jgi:hypothetical protein
LECGQALVEMIFRHCRHPKKDKATPHILPPRKLAGSAFHRP